MKDRLHDCAVRISKLVKLNAPLCILAKEVEYFDFLASEVWREAGTTYAALLEEHERLTDKGKDV
jgi:hypothetical protein